uniref:Death domain-containing protein n=1 Tax=Pavo cristatus TaxID=9049 RepID=A0A8C9EHS5_PAVCR
MCFRHSSPPHLPKGVNSSVFDLTSSPVPRVSNGTAEPTVDSNDTSANGTVGAPGSLSNAGTAGQAQSYRHKHTSQAMGKQPAQEVAGGEKSSIPYRPPRRGPPNVHQHFDINEHLPWMIVLFLLLVLVVIVVCSVRKSSRTLKKGPRQDPSAIVEKAIMKKSTTPTQNREKWIYYCNGHGIDILKLVAAQVGSQWKDIYQFLCNASEREVAAFSNGYAADHERAYAALQHWTIRGPEASLAQLISALRQHRRNDVVEKIRGLMEDTTPVQMQPQWQTQDCSNDDGKLEGDKLALPVSPSPLSPVPAPSTKPPEAAVLTVEPSPSEKKCFFVDESEPLLRCDSTSSGSSALSRTGSFITKGTKIGRGGEGSGRAAAVPGAWPRHSPCQQHTRSCPVSTEGVMSVKQITGENQLSRICYHTLSQTGSILREDFQGKTPLKGFNSWRRCQKRITLGCLWDLLAFGPWGWVIA